MNVLVITEPGVDGVFRYVDTLCHHLWREGVSVHLAYSDRRGSDRLMELVREVEDRGGRTLNLKTANRPALGDVRAFRGLMRLMREVRPAVVHSHSSKAGFLGRALRFCGFRAVQCYHPHAYVGMRPQPGRFDFVYNLIEAVMGRFAHTVVVSQDEQAFALERLKLPSQRLHLIPNGIDLDAFPPAVSELKVRTRERLDLPRDALILGCMGRSSEQKDPLTLYRAFAQAAALRPVVLLHVGRGELDAEIDALVAAAQLKDRVHRIPYTSKPREFYQAVDGFILTSRYEGLSLAVIEALAANLPLILSDAPGNRDFLTLPLSHRWQANVGDVDGFARGIVAWHDRMRDPRAAPVNHRQVAESNYDVRDRCGAVLELYRSLGAVEPAESQDDAASNSDMMPSGPTSR